jgi:hypothetical protein
LTRRERRSVVRRPKPFTPEARVSGWERSRAAPGAAPDRGGQ